MRRFPLAGVWVAGFTWHGAGPFTTKVLVGHGEVLGRSNEEVDRLIEEGVLV